MPTAVDLARLRAIAPPQGPRGILSAYLQQQAELLQHATGENESQGKGSVRGQGNAQKVLPVSRKGEGGRLLSPVQSKTPTANPPVAVAATSPHVLTEDARSKWVKIVRQPPPNPAPHQQRKDGDIARARVDGVARARVVHVHGGQGNALPRGRETRLRKMPSKGILEKMNLFEDAAGASECSPAAVKPLRSTFRTLQEQNDRGREGRERNREDGKGKERGKEDESEPKEAEEEREMEKERGRQRQILTERASGGQAVPLQDTAPRRDFDTWQLSEDDSMYNSASDREPAVWGAQRWAEGPVAWGQGGTRGGPEPSAGRTVLGAGNTGPMGPAKQVSEPDTWPAGRKDLGQTGRDEQGKGVLPSAMGPAEMQEKGERGRRMKENMAPATLGRVPHPQRAGQPLDARDSQEPMRSPFEAGAGYQLGQLQTGHASIGVEAGETRAGRSTVEPEAREDDPRESIAARPQTAPGGPSKPFWARPILQCKGMAEGSWMGVKATLMQPPRSATLEVGGVALSEMEPTSGGEPMPGTKKGVRKSVRVPQPVPKEGKGENVRVEGAETIIGADAEKGEALLRTRRSMRPSVPYDGAHEGERPGDVEADKAKLTDGRWSSSGWDGARATEGEVLTEVKVVHQETFPHRGQKVDEGTLLSSALIHSNKEADGMPAPPAAHFQKAVKLYASGRPQERRLEQETEHNVGRGNFQARTGRDSNAPNAVPALVMPAGKMNDRTERKKRESSLGLKGSNIEAKVKRKGAREGAPSAPEEDNPTEEWERARLLALASRRGRRQVGGKQADEPSFGSACEANYKGVQSREEGNGAETLQSRERLYREEGSSGAESETEAIWGALSSGAASAYDQMRMEEASQHPFLQLSRWQGTPMLLAAPLTFMIALTEEEGRHRQRGASSQDWEGGQGGARHAKAHSICSEGPSTTSRNAISLPSPLQQAKAVYKRTARLMSWPPRQSGNLAKAMTRSVRRVRNSWRKSSRRS